MVSRYDIIDGLDTGNILHIGGFFVSGTHTPQTSDFALQGFVVKFWSCSFAGALCSPEPSSTSTDRRSCSVHSRVADQVLGR